MITQERLKEVLNYDPITGIFVRKVRTSQNARIGDLAGNHPQKDGYCYIGVDGKSYQAHKLAILYVDGLWPKEVDHIDKNRANNIYSNLRKASRQENSFNKAKYSNNKSGYKGVSKHSQMNKFRASIGYAGKTRHIGLFDSAIDAAKAYDKVAMQLHGEFCRLNFPNEGKAGVYPA